MAKPLSTEQLNELQTCSPEEGVTWVRTFPTDVIVATLLELHEARERTRSYGKTHRLRKTLLAKAALELLDPDEREAVRRRAQEIVDGLS
jgi:hypothetical protein